MSARPLARATTFATLAAVTASGVFIFACATDEANATNEPPSPSPLPEAAVDGGSPSPDACAADVCSAPPVCSGAAFCVVNAPVPASIAINTVWGSSASDVWLTGTRGTLVHFDGAAFANVPVGAPPTEDALFGIWGSAPDDLWIASASTPFHSTGWKGGGATWEAVPGSNYVTDAYAQNGRVWGVTGSGKDDVWLFGERSFRYDGIESSLWRRDADSDGGTKWTPMTMFESGYSPSVRALWGSPSTRAWSVSPINEAASIDARDGGDGGPTWWESLNPRSSTGLESLWRGPNGDLWAVGSGGNVRRSIGGAARAWEIVPSSTTESLHGVWGAADDDVWAVGDHGTVIHWNGSAWSPATIATLTTTSSAPDLYTVWGSGADDVWIAGASVVLRSRAKVTP